MGKANVEITRRSLIAASAGMLLPRWMRAAPREAPVLHWRFDGTGDSAVDSAGGGLDAIASRTGHAIWVGEGSNRALRLDGYSVWLRHKASRGVFSGDSLTVMAWIALESYPVNEAALVQMDGQSSTIFRFSIDRLGFLQFGQQPGDTKSICRSSGPVPKGRWVHLAAAVGDSGLTLWIDGASCGHLQQSGSKLHLGDEATFVLSRSPDGPLAAEVFPTGVLNGLLRDVRIYDTELQAARVMEIMQQSRPEGSLDLQINRPWCEDDPQRPIAHAQPPRAWTNEPHGLIHWGGQYHLFYQKNPNGPYWGHIQWGHMTSPDLLRWTEMPVALCPEPGFDSEGCWSGSVIEHHGKLAILYTGVDGVKAGIGLALSDDGIHFTKHSANPVIAHPPLSGDFLDFRDPFVWHEGDAYYLIVGAGVKDVGGTALLYRSTDLVNWEYRKQILSGDTGASGYFWEMPVFVKSGDRHALIVSELPARSSYWVGSWKDETFTPVSSTPQRLELFNHLLSPTPAYGEDGQLVVMGIIPEERPPRELWAAGWAHLYSLPRSLSIDAAGALLQTPHPSLEKLCRPLAAPQSLDIAEGTVQALPDFAETSFRLRATLKPGLARSISLLLRRSPDGREQTEIAYDWNRGRLILDRTKSSLNPAVKRDRQETAYVAAEKDSIRLDVFVDRSVLEVFVENRAAFAARLYPTLTESAGVAFASAGAGARVQDIRVDRIERPV